MWKFWLIIAGFSFVIESFTVGFFIFWFGIGALLALAVSFITTNLVIQSLTFILSSCLLLVLTKPLVKRFVKNTPLKKTNVYSVINKEGIVLEDISELESTGKVKINGELWSATAKENIEKNTKVKVVDINGVKLTVEKITSDITK